MKLVNAHILLIAGLIFAGAAVSSCTPEVGPDDFEDTVTETSVHKVELKDVNQSIRAHDFRYPPDVDFVVEPQIVKKIEVVLADGEGTLITENGVTTLNLVVNTNALSESNYGPIYDIMGFTIRGFSMQLTAQVHNDVKNSGLAGQTANCSTAESVLRIEKYDYTYQNIDTIEYPLDAFVELTSHTTDDDETGFRGQLLFYFDENAPKCVSPHGKGESRIEQFILTADIEIE